MLIGKINDKTRRKILVTVKKIKKVAMIDMRVHEISNDRGVYCDAAGLSHSGSSQTSGRTTHGGLRKADISRWNIGMTVPWLALGGSDHRIPSLPG